MTQPADRCAPDCIEESAIERPLYVLVSGRQALPIRAIPIASNWSLPPGDIAYHFARLGDKATERLRNQFAFRRDGNRSHRIANAEWNDVWNSFLELQTDISVSFNNGRDAFFAAYIHELELLPAGTFVWLDKFQFEWNVDQKRFDGSLIDVPSLTLAPLIKARQYDLIMEGFDHPQLEPSTPSTIAKPVPRQRFQEDKIIEALESSGYSPQALPPREPGRPGVKSIIRKEVKFSDPVFDKAWERLRKEGRIKEQDA